MNNSPAFHVFMLCYAGLPFRAFVHPVTYRSCKMFMRCVHIVGVQNVLRLPILFIFIITSQPSQAVSAATRVCSILKDYFSNSLQTRPYGSPVATNLVQLSELSSPNNAKTKTKATAKSGAQTGDIAAPKNGWAGI
jgi:hypothetical protein